MSSVVNSAKLSFNIKYYSTGRLNELTIVKWVIYSPKKCYHFCLYSKCHWNDHCLIIVQISDFLKVGRMNFLPHSTKSIHQISLVGQHLEYAMQVNCLYLKKDIYHLERIQLATTRLVKGLTYKALKLQFLGKRNDWVLTHKILYNQIGMKTAQLFKFFRRPGLGRSSLRLLLHTGRTRKIRRNRFACRVVKHWNRLPLAVASVPEQRTFEKRLDLYPIYAQKLRMRLNLEFCL